eukprot:ANDGO_07372.mRNA.1 Sensor histidine kinase TmoS
MFPELEEEQPGIMDEYASKKPQHSIAMLDVLKDPGLSGRERLLHEVFPGDFETSRYARSFDWERSPLGPVESWPKSLCSLVSATLACGVPMCLFAGPSLVFLYNDPYIAICRAKHPHLAFGVAGRLCWPEVWDQIEGSLMDVMEKGISWSFEDRMMLLNRSDFGLEEAYQTFSYSPGGLNESKVCAVFCAVQETTERVVEGRRLQTKNDLSGRLLRCKTVRDVFCNAILAVQRNNFDFPFALFYQTNGSADVATLVSSAGFSSDPSQVHPLCPQTVLFAQTTAGKMGDHGPDPWQFGLHTMSRNGWVIDVSKYDRVPKGYWESYPQVSLTKAVVFPLYSALQNTPVGFCIFGSNPAKPLDKFFMDFCTSICGQMSSAASSVQAFETETRRAEELAKLDHAKTVFFSNISHELRTPLNLMLGPLADALADTQNPLARMQRERMEMVNRNGSRLLRLVNNLLDFSRIEAGRSQCQFVPTNLPGMTLEIASLFQPLMEKAGLDFRVLLSSRLSQDVFVDRSMWEKIVANLLSNAFKFTFKGFIQVSISEDEKGAVLEVSDSGTGIPQPELPRVFERFHRIENSKGRNYEGSGIGLALTLELVRLHGGTIDVASELGCGTTFRVRIPFGFSHLAEQNVLHSAPALEDSSSSFHHNDLPVSTYRPSGAFVEEAATWMDDTPPQSEDDNDTSSASSDSADYGDATILLADDNPDMRSYVKGILKRYWKVDLAKNGQEALFLSEKKKYDLILSDVMMPVMDGFELMRRLRQNPFTCSTPVIILSARAGEEAKIEGLQKGADDYIVKTSFSAKELIARVKNHLELGRLRFHLENEVSKRTEELREANRNLELQIVSRKEIEKALAESELRFRVLASVAPVGILHTDRSGWVNYINPWVEKMFGSTVDTMNATWSSMIIDDDRQAAVDEWTDFLRQWESGQSATLHMTYRIVNKSMNPPLRWLLVQGMPELGERNIPCGFILTITDITEQKRIEEEQLTASKRQEEFQLERAKEAEYRKTQLEDFIDTICHEIRNPVSGTLFSLHQQSELISDIKRVLADEESKLLQRSVAASTSLEAAQRSVWKDLKGRLALIEDCVECIQVCSDHQMSVLGEVIELSKISSKGLLPHESWFPLSRVVQNVVLMYEQHFQSGDIRFTPCIQLEDDIEVFTDEVKLTQVLINLFSNATKYTPSQGYIVFSVSSTPSTANQPRTSRCVFSISNSGSGFDVGDLEGVFDKFSKVSRSHKFDGVSTGLGLPICKELTTLMGGTITAESDPGRETRFVAAFDWQSRISSPLSQPSSINTALTATTLPPSPQQAASDDADQKTGNTPRRLSFFAVGPKARILIADDNLISQKAMSRILSKSGFTCFVADDGVEAVEQYQKHRPDLVFLDIEMPRLTGTEACRQIRRIEKSESIAPVPIIALSGYSRDETQKEALEAGMNLYLTKPVRPAELERLLAVPK